MMERIDLELVKRNIFTTRNKAQYAIKSGIVFCNGQKVNKNGFLVNEEDIITIVGEVMPYVSKGGLKLEKAINCFHISLTNKKMIDIGSSTGGFSDCALQNNVKEILAIDVGTMQLDPKLRQNKKITLMENTDFRFIDNQLLKDYTIATIDVSFISVAKLIPKLSTIPTLEEVIFLLKPQFEVGINLAKKYNGVIINKEAHYNVLNNIIKEFENISFTPLGLTFSPIKGGSGNIEYLLYFKKGIVGNNKIDILNVIDEAFKTLLK